MPGNATAALPGFFCVSFLPFRPIKMHQRMERNKTIT